ncbi:MAG: GC-type dockerin domain-anchored protein [Phycisphaerales bacterium]
MDKRDGAVNLGVLAGGSIGSASASEVSDDGLVVVGSSAASGSTQSHAFRWTQADGMVDLGTLAGGTSSVANGISGDGQVVVGYSTSSEGQRAIRWAQAGGMQNLGTITGYTASLALGADADGSVIVGYAQVTGSARALRWVDGAVEVIDPIPGYTSSYGYACSTDGSVVIGRVFGVGAGGEAFRWSTVEGLEGIGRLEGDTSAFALGVSGDGNTIVGLSQGASARAFIWMRSIGIVDLNTYLPTQGADLSGWVLNSATDISPDGRSVVGYGLHNGVQEAWRARLETPCAADLGAAGGVPGQDGHLDNNDFIAFISYFFAADSHADLGIAGGLPGSDGQFNNNDFIAFINYFFAGC